MPERTVLSDDLSHCQDLVRREDHDRYLATLFAPAEARPALFALAAFNVEIAKVRDRVSAPLPGEIRLQWWRDALSDAGAGEAGGHPVARALNSVVDRWRLPRESLSRMIDARIFDLYNDPMPSLTDLEAYAGETAAALFQLGAIVLARGEDPRTAEAAGHAGVAVAIAGVLRNLPVNAARGQIYLPADLLDRHGVDSADLLAGRTTPALRGAAAELIARARRHLAETRGALDAVAPALRPAFLLSGLVEPYLRRLENPKHDLLRGRVEIPTWRKILTLWRTARRAE